MAHIYTEGVDYMGRRKYTLNIEPFKIDSHAKYYWLGVLATDGNVAKKEARIRLELKNDDIDLLKNLANFCETNIPLHTRINNSKCECSCLDINSSELKKYLAEYNIVPDKTKTFIMPLGKIPDKYLWDFIRGMMDGDGCITYIKSHVYNPYGISFVSANLECVKQMKKIWELPEEHKISINNGAYILQKSGKGCLSILEKMYMNSTEQTRLNRKY